MAPNDPLARSVVGLLDMKSNEMCAATLLSNRLAITAAHCFVQDKLNSRLLFGIDLNQKGLIEREVSSIRVCPGFVPNNQKDSNCDVALLEFEGGLPEGYRPMELLWESAPLVPNRYLTVVGYGMNDTDAWLGEGVLRKAQVPIFNPNFSANEFLMDQRKGKGACHGDSGAAIIYQEEGEPPYLAGVVNRGHLDVRSKCNQYGVGLSVPAVYDWILSNLTEL